MLTKTKLALAAALVIGSATIASAEGVSFNEQYAPAAVQQQTFTSRSVALPRTQAPVAQDEYINRASQTVDGGAS
jgi:hypothetical protein